MRIVATKVGEEYWNFETDQMRQVTQTVSCAVKPACDVVMVTDFGPLRFTLYEPVMEDVALSCTILFILRAGTKALQRPICLETRHDLCFPHN